jgi:hypothetical protein
MFSSVRLNRSSASGTVSALGRGLSGMAKPSGDDFQDFCTMLGMMTLTWAWIENALALSIGIIDESGLKPRPDRGLPISLSGKLKYLRAALGSVSPVKPLKDRGVALMDKLSTLANRRNAFVHASIGPIERGNGLESTLFPNDGSHPTRAPVSMADAIALNIAIDDLVEETIWFLMEIATALPR